MDNGLRILPKAPIDSPAHSDKLGLESSGIATKDGGKHNKHGCTKVSFEDKFKIEPDVAISELLGSVTTHNCPGVRASARVIQKMKQDQCRPTSPPPTERDHRQREERGTQKTPSHMRAIKPVWSNIERNHFFDALNEFGKDFEAIGNYINAKLKRKCGSDATFKTKDQVRQHYYQTFHKICKYIRFSDEVKKPAQEMYALINYGEMRRKLQFVSDKHILKLKSLIYQGKTTVRLKGKNIRIKTPSCKALRRLNQLDDSLEDIRLPAKIEVIVSPANMASFGRVQTIAQNPRVRVIVPLQKKLINFIKSFQYKWRSREMKFAAEEAKLFPSHTNPASSCFDSEQSVAAVSSPGPVKCQDPDMCFLPKPGVTIHRPLLSITEYLSSVNICLAAYEERMGIKVRGQTLCIERSSNKRQRTESGSDKRSPDAKKQKNLLQAEKTEIITSAAAAQLPPLSVVKEEFAANDSEVLSVTVIPEADATSAVHSEELSAEIKELLNDCDTPDKVKSETYEIKLQEEPSIVTTKSATPTFNSGTSTQNTHLSNATTTRSRRSNNAKARNSLNWKPLISADVITRIRRGWTVSNAADTTIGDLYVVFGQDSKLELDYFWTKNTAAGANFGTAQKQNGMPYNPNDCDDSQLMETLSTSSISNKLKHLLLIANLSERIRKRQCSCAHTCEKSPKGRIERGMATKTFISNKTFLPNANAGDNNHLFRQPIAPMRRTVLNMESLKQLSVVSRPKMSPRHVLVQRLLLPGGVNHLELLNTRNVPRTFNALSEDSLSLPSATQNTTTKYINENGSTLTASVSSNSNLIPAPGQEDGSHMPALTDIRHDGVNQSEPDITEPTKDPTDPPLTTPTPAPFDDITDNNVYNGMSPMHLLRESSSSNSRWLEENLNDFSLTSLLGHLDDINTNRDLLDPSSNLSVISENSVDYMSKFQEITALMRGQDND